jgi:hypothetical protein
MKLLKYLFVGFLFGIVLTKTEAVSWYRIYEMFHFQSFHMFGIIGTAIATGFIGIQIIKRKKLTGIRLGISRSLSRTDIYLIRSRFL